MTPFLDVKLASIRDHLEAPYAFITFASPAHATQAIANLMTCDLNVNIDTAIACKPPTSHTSNYDTVTIYPPATGKPWQMPLYCIVKGCSRGPELDLAPSFLSQHDLNHRLDHFHHDILRLLNTSPLKSQDYLGLMKFSNPSCVRSIFYPDLFLNHLETCGNAPQTSLQRAAAAGATASRTHTPPALLEPSSDDIHMHQERTKPPAVKDHRSTYPMAFAILKPVLHAEFNAFLNQQLTPLSQNEATIIAADRQHRPHGTPLSHAQC
jgi:hypothetical protein